MSDLLKDIIKAAYLYVPDFKNKLPSIIEHILFELNMPDKSVSTSSFSLLNSKLFRVPMILTLIQELSLSEKNEVIKETLKNRDIRVEELLTIFKTLFDTSNVPNDLPLFSRPVIDLIYQLIEPLEISNSSQLTPICPRCLSSKIVRNGIYEGKQQYLCKKCKSQFVK